ncbi:MAG: helix-turn-helix domain-containing protein [Oscillospiraceae bacterium]|jgi:transcriptional regulator with XRE-family HTH domain|nr:helix-turn-helix domain-containing protein [Oscillospiraceae bacterium]
MNLGSRIREARLQKQLTQKDVVGEYMTRNMLSKIENGSATPSVKTLEFLSAALELPISYLVSEEGAAAPPETSSSDAAAPPELAHLNEIAALADALLGEASPYVRACACCVKARALMAGQNAAGALAFLETLPLASFDSDGVKLISKTAEECCIQLGDYKKAYDFAVRRMDAE